MDKRSGEILTAEEVQRRLRACPNDKPYFSEMIVPPTPLQRQCGKVGRNEPCPCGSGVKFKKCCLISDTSAPSAVDEGETA